MEVRRHRSNAMRLAGPWSTIRAEIETPVLQPLLAASTAMIVLHLLEARSLVDTSQSSIAFALDVDRGLSELLGYLIIGMIVAGFVSLAHRLDHDRLLYAAAGFFAFALADDLLMIHERVGARAADRLGPDALGGIDVALMGEAAFLALIGAIGLIVGLTGDRTVAPLTGLIIRWVGGLLLGFGLVSVGIPVLAEMTAISGRGISPVLVVVSDGGELMILSVIASLVFARLREVDAMASIAADDFVFERAIIDLERRPARESDESARQALITR